MRRVSRREFLSAMIAAGAAAALPVEFLFAATENEWPNDVGHFPAVAVDESGGIWMASTGRATTERFIKVDLIENGQRKLICRLQPEGLTGIAPPAIAAWENGCIVAFPVEQNDKWRIACCFIDSRTSQSPVCTYLPSEGSANISPAIALANDRAWIVWESNAGKGRCICSTWVRPGGHGNIERISTRDANSYDPAIVALDDGTLFAAWDSVRKGSADIWGAWLKNGKWQKEKRLTSAAGIERHPHLASRGSDVWMTWQAQACTKGRRVNLLDEQLIVVARLEDGEMRAPLGLFQEVSTNDRKLMRPRMGFDHSGALWLTARLGMPMLQAGWKPVMWRYAGRQWTEMSVLTDQEGRWHPVPMAFLANSDALAVLQHDNIQKGYDQTMGMECEFQSALEVKAISRNGPPLQPITEPLQMPETKFSLAEKMELCSADLPRQNWPRAGEKLTLYWGDLHDHTDLSVCDRRQNPPGHDLFANLRDIEKLDFAALTDHGYNFDPAQWQLNGEQTRNNHDPGRFVTFLGQEWTSSVMRKSGGYGHRNLIYLDPYYDKFYDSFDGDVTPADVWKQIGETEFICIPHQLADWKGKGLGNPPTDWNFVDEKLQPVAEIWQVRGSYEYLGCPRQAGQGKPEKGHYLQDAWAMGNIIGVIASPDHGGGAGKVGVWAPDLSREAIFRAIQARHTFGTSGAKMALRFSAGDAIMGDKVNRTAGPIRFSVSGEALHEITRMVIFRNNKAVYITEPGKTKFDLEWTDEEPPDVERLWYYARIRAADNELAWSSPIWFLA